MAGLKIEEKRLPQDGQSSVMIEGKPIDFRINTLPTWHGEKVVLRVVDKSSLQVDMTKLGFEDNMQQLLREINATARGIRSSRLIVLSFDRPPRMKCRWQLAKPSVERVRRYASPKNPN